MLKCHWPGFSLAGVLTMGLALCLLPIGASGQNPTSAPASAAENGGADLNVTDKGTVELHVQGTDLRGVLKLLSNQGKTNIIATKEVQGQVTADLYGVTFTEALDAVLKSNGFGYERKGNFIYVYTAKQLEELQLAARQPAIKVFNLNYITANDAKALITPVLSKDGNISTTPAAAVGVGSAKDQAGGNALAGSDVIIVRDYPENLEKITEIIQRLDTRPQQVLIEATILRASLDEQNQLGVNFNVLAGIDFHGFGSSTDLSNGITGGSVSTDSCKSAISTGFVLPSGGLSVGFISNNIAVFIKALETVTDTVVLANPKLLVMNKQRGEVMVGARDGYKTTTVSQNVVTETVEFLETGTQLIVRPYIGTDGYVRLEVHPEDSTGGLVNGLPSEKTTEATSNVLVKDGHTIVIGGLFRDRTDIARQQIPYLGNIPIAGNLFRNRSDTTSREEVIILITPHIIKQAPDEVASEQMREDVDRMWLGHRQGMMWFGRERLAQSYMTCARQKAACGDFKCALWDTRLALSLEPRNLDALRMKEQLTCQAIWATETRSGNAKYVVEELIMNELGLPSDMVVPPTKPLDVNFIPPEAREALGIQKRITLPFPPDVWNCLRCDWEQAIINGTETAIGQPAVKTPAAPEVKPEPPVQTPAPVKTSPAVAPPAVTPPEKTDPAPAKVEGPEKVSLLEGGPLDAFFSTFLSKYAACGNSTTSTEGVSQ